MLYSEKEFHANGETLCAARCQVLATCGQILADVADVGSSMVRPANGRLPESVYTMKAEGLPAVSDVGPYGVT